MSLVINTNIASLNGQRNLAATQAQQAQTFQRLSTGLRVNSAKDDAGGLYLAQAQTKDIRGLGMATRNAGDGISMAQTAEGALDQIGKNLQRINELAIQSANGTYSAEARGGLQKEVDQLTQEVNRIIETTEFNGKKLLNSDAITETLQIGFQDNAGSRIGTGLEGGIQGQLNENQYVINGTEQVLTLDSTTISDGKTTDADVVKTANKQLAEQFGVSLNDAGDEFEIGDSLADAILGAQAAAQAAATAAAPNSDSATKTSTFTQGGITYTAEVTATKSTGGTASFSDFTIAAADSNGDPVTLGGGSTSGTAFTKETIAGWSIGGEDEALEAKTAVEVYSANALSNILDGGLLSTRTIDISTQESAQVAISQTRNAVDLVSELRAEFGANQNRFEAVISGNQTYSENLSAARSRIQDADFAVETANLAKQQVLQQAGIAALGQANASSQVVLGLL